MIEEYKKITLNEAIRCMQKGEDVYYYIPLAKVWKLSTERNTLFLKTHYAKRVEKEWAVSNPHSVSVNLKYVKRVEKIWEPEKGKWAMFSINPITDNNKGNKRRFGCKYNDLYYAENIANGKLTSWQHCAPIPKETKLLEGWVLTHQIMTKHYAATHDMENYTHVKQVNE